MKKACYGMLILAVVCFLIGVLSPGGISGTVGTICIMLAFFAIVLAVVMAIFWVACGLTAAWLAPRHPRDFGIRASAPHAVHADHLDPTPIVDATRAALLVRGVDWDVGGDAAEFLNAVERARGVNEFSSEEASAMLSLVSAALLHKNEGMSWWSANEAAEAHIGTPMQRLRIAPGTETRRDHVQTAKPNRSGGFKASDPTEEAPKYSLEHGFGIAAAFAFLGFFLIKGFLVFFSTPGLKQAKPAWALSLGVACLVTISINWLLKWRRKRAAEWRLHPTPTGFRADIKRFAGRSIDVPADECWAYLQESDTAGALSKPRLHWTFVFREPPGELTCDGFDPTGTPWQTWLEEFNAAIEIAHSRSTQPNGSSTTVP